MTTTAKDMIQASYKKDTWGRNVKRTAEHAALAAKLNEEAQANWDSAEWHRQVAADLAESLDYGFTFDNVFGTYIKVLNLGFTDRYTIRERKGLKVFWTSRGGYINESQLQTERFEVPRDTLGFHVSEHEDKLRINFADTIEDLAALGQRRLEVGQPTCAAADGQPAVAVEQRDARGVVAAVLHPAQRVDHDPAGVPRSDVADDSAHGGGCS